jgi:Skp family chaperone for outer membrane proteins
MQKDVFEHMHKAFPELTPPQHGNKADHKKLKAFYNEIDAEADKIKKEMNKVLGGMIPEIMSDIKKRLAEAMDNKASAEFVRTRDAIGMHAKQILDRYDSNRDEIHSQAFKAVEVEGNNLIEKLRLQTEAKIDEIRAEVEKPDSKFNDKPKRKSGMRM